MINFGPTTYKLIYYNYLQKPPTIHQIDPHLISIVTIIKGLTIFSSITEDRIRISNHSYELLIYMILYIIVNYTYIIIILRQAKMYLTICDGIEKN